MEIDYLLSDEFVRYSKEITKLHAEKQSKKQELKAFYDKIQLEIQKINEIAAQLTQEFEAWRSGVQIQSKGDTHEST